MKKKININIDKQTVKKYTRPMWIFSIIVLTVWVGLLILGSFIMSWAEQITAGEDEDSYIILIVTCFILASLVIAVPTTVIFVNAATKTASTVNAHLSKIARGDFNTKIETKSKNAFVTEMVDVFNLTVDQLNSVAVMKNDFISTFSHEFKTPMFSIKGYAELLKDADNLTEEQQDFVKIIISESERLSKLSEKVMMLSKIDNQVIISDRQDFFVDGQIEETILLFDGQLREKRLELNADIKRVKINADPELIKEVWINVIGNAVKYTENGGKIDVSCEKKDGNLVVVVKDNGIGMSKETVEHVFDKFYQADGNHSRGGIGLGLTLCKKITEMFNGNISCDSEEGKYTVFTITLPCL